jgi:arylsulfatase
VWADAECQRATDGGADAWRPPQVDGQDVVFPATYREDRRLLAQDELPTPFYSSAVFTDRWLDFHAEARAESPHKPWLGLLTFTAPHWPLQAPREVCERYRGVYADGPDALRQRRLAGLVKAGLVTEDAASAAAPARERYCGRDTSWAAMSAQEQAESQRAMEVYAAMVELMDANIGRVLQRLRETGELDNTFILFMSGECV